MQILFESLDSIIDLPFVAFEKRLAKLEEDFRDIDVAEISDEELESYFLRIKESYEITSWETAKNRLEILGYLSHFDVLVEKYFPEYVTIFQSSLIRKDVQILFPMIRGFLEHMDEIFRDYTHRLSEPDQYPSYTGFIQELIQNSMIDLFFWLQDRENELEKNARTEERNTHIAIIPSSETRDIDLKITRECLEILGEGVLDKIFFDHEYPIKTSPLDPELHLLGRYERKK